ncbi:hypothetical protein WJX81_002052 [Elliptochloris bilobata]|uniref:Transglutaminase-like domain-containing protein n=1 Tax=Elliptochloris bilobata TaxID=381761 RepID=A0AAW1SLC8_9CHLO
MDLDEALACQLQDEEAAAAATSQGPSCKERLQEQANAAIRYEDELLQSLALSVIPLDLLEQEAAETAASSSALGEEPPLSPADALALLLLEWFKRFFTWVDNAPCQACGSSSTQAFGHSSPTVDEAAGEASRVEVYRCTQCSAFTRFPRYNDPARLLETRQGRCGEFANCFVLCLRAAGLEARHVSDWADHVWAEYWSAAQQRWVHLDPCEGAFDKPLLYEAGWGKRPAYALAAAATGVADVTRRYTTAYAEALSRRALCPEAELAGACVQVNARLRAALPAERRAALEERDRWEEAELDSRQRRGAHGAELTGLPGRQTGSAEWVQQRGEGGAGGAGARARAPPTRYRAAKDGALAVRGDGCARLCGGYARASGENAPGETAARAFDGSLATKWLDFGAAGGGTAWLEYILPPGREPAAVLRYVLTSANDAPERDPRDWKLEGLPANDRADDSGAGSWLELDRRENVAFRARGQAQTFRVACPAACRAYRLAVSCVREPWTANSVQLAGLDLLLGSPAEQAEAAAVCASAAPLPPRASTLPQEMARLGGRRMGAASPLGSRFARLDLAAPAPAPASAHATALAGLSPNQAAALALQRASGRA